MAQKKPSCNFATESFIFKSSYLEPCFIPTVGYVGPSCVFRAIANRTMGMNIDDRYVYEEAIFGKFDLDSEAVQNGFEYMKQIVQEYRENNLIVLKKHDTYNIIGNKIIALDNFISCLNLFNESKWYLQIMNNFSGMQDHHNDKKFLKLPFQQFMFIDKVITMIMRSDVSEYADIILMEMKHSLGLPSMTFVQCYSLIKTFNKKVVTHVIPRRHGKTVFTNLLNALCLVFFPTCHLKISYIAHTKDLTGNAFKTVKDIVDELQHAFNQTQRLLYDSHPEHDSKNVDDNYYFYKSSIKYMEGTALTCYFDKISYRNRSRITHNVVLQNELKCIVYAKIDVSLAK